MKANFTMHKMNEYGTDTCECPFKVQYYDDTTCLLKDEFKMDCPLKPDEKVTFKSMKLIIQDD